MIFNLGIESLEFTVDEVTTFDVILLSFDESPQLFLLLVTLTLLADFADDGEFRTTDAGFGLTTQLPVDVACKQENHLANSFLLKQKYQIILSFIIP